MNKATYKDRFFDAYLECLAWSSTNHDGESLDGLWFSDDAETASREDCDNFVDDCWRMLNNLDASQCGHDFALTRNGHGAGFWDRGLGAVGDLLTDACRPYGGVDCYLNDNEEIEVA